MTVKLLCDWEDSRTGRRYKSGNLLTTDAGTEAGLVAAKLADMNLTGGTNYISPVVDKQIFPVIAEFNSVTEGIGSLTAGGRDALSAYVKGARSPMPAVGGSVLVIGDVSVVAGSPTVTIETGPNGKPAIKVVTAVGVHAEIKFPGLVGAYTGGDAYLCMHGSYSQSNVDYVTCYVSQDAAGYAKGWSNKVQYALAAPLNSPKEQGGAVTYMFRKGANANFGAPTYPAYIADMKLRIMPKAGAAATVWIYAFGFSTPRTKGRICVTWDDGYDSTFKLGYDIFASREIKQTLAVIGSTQGTGNGYSNIDQLHAFLNAGNALVAHGPWPNSGAGNLFTAYPGSANPVSDAVADMTRNLAYLRDNGLLVPGAESCYVWPQGVFQQSVNDTALLDAAIAAGFTLGRSASASTAHIVNIDAASKYGRMALPIIGHTWAGTTAAEATNITAITTAIAALSTDKSDGFLMLHRVQPTTTADGAMSAIGIRHADLETIAAAIKAGVDAGTLEPVTMPELAANGSGYWGSF
ncbi:hypothetical protein [Pseudomonas sp.]|uniref:hypothetical protein n=1 Tax=Pseudomonas sp. TaxID=306 RepID=UPI003F2C4595